MSEQKVVAYAFTVTPVLDDRNIEAADPFERVMFENPNENYGHLDGFEVSNVRELTEIQQ
jgi:hypothetical protein